MDEFVDYEFVQAVFHALYPANPRFTTDDILRLLAERPELTEINYHIIHGQGYQKSLREDAAFSAATNSTKADRPDDK
jgi:spore coat polysaccharide biosynthesis protein SpsF